MRIAIVALLALGLSGCLADVLMSTAIQGELQAKNASAAQNVLNHTKNSTAQMELERAISAYHAEKGEYPPSLNVLGFSTLPTRADGSNFGYNPVTGQVLDTDQGPSPADFLLMEDIAQAINAYGTASGLYPPTLDTLAEVGYLPQLPRTSDGQEFIYNNQNGAFSHPLEGHVSAARPQPGGAPQVGGGGPLGEANTSIAIQEQLNSNSNAGASRARSAGSTGINRATNTQNDRQQQALEDLDL